jgi:hypothetical protein
MPVNLPIKNAPDRRREAPMTVIRVGDGPEGMRR